MPNIHLRDLPLAALDTLKEAALDHGRSLNGELVHLLTEEAEQIRRTREFLATVRPRKLRKPVDLEAMIRDDRDARPGGTP